MGEAQEATVGAYAQASGGVKVNVNGVLISFRVPRPIPMFWGGGLSSHTHNTKQFPNTNRMSENSTNF